MEESRVTGCVQNDRLTFRLLTGDCLEDSSSDSESESKKCLDPEADRIAGLAGWNATDPTASRADIKTFAYEKLLKCTIVRFEMQNRTTDYGIRFPIIQKNLIDHVGVIDRKDGYITNLLAETSVGWKVTHNMRTNLIANTQHPSSQVDIKS